MASGSTSTERSTAPSAQPLGRIAALRRLYGFMSQRRRRQFALLFGLMLAGGLAELLMIGSVVAFLALLTGAPGTVVQAWLAPLFELFGAVSSGERLRIGAGLFIAAVILAASLRLQLAWSSQGAVLGFAHELAVEIQRRILLQPYSYHLSHNSSEVVASLEMVQGMVGPVLMQWMRAVTAVLISLFIIAALMAIDPAALMMAAVAFGLIYGLVAAFTRSRLNRNSQVVGPAYEQRVKLVQESIGGIRDVIIDDSQALYVEEFRRLDGRFMRARLTTAFMATAPRLVIEAAGFVVIAGLALLLSSRAAGVAGAIPILGGLAIGAQRLLPLMQQLYLAWAQFIGNRSVLTQVLELLQLPVDDSQLALPRPDPLAFRDRISFGNVSFCYPGGARTAIEDVSLTIRRGSRVAVVGRTGSGKTTLADLLMGLIEPTDGTITIDGVALTQKTRRAWQQSIAHVPQTVFLADASIARNIAFGVPTADIDFDRVRRAAQSAQLKEHIESLPAGYETTVGERGARLSGGQRQRLGLARAIYKQAPVLVLDEATSSLDRITEEAIMQTLDQLEREGCTIIIIAHRKSTIEGCDLVVRLEKGRLVDSGNADEVLVDERRRRAASD